MKPKTNKKHIQNISPLPGEYTDLSKPLVIYDDAKFEAAMDAVVRILWSRPRVAETTEKAPTEPPKDSL
jgi:hypothetical protein